MNRIFIKISDFKIKFLIWMSLLLSVTYNFFKFKEWDFDDGFIVYRLVDRMSRGLGWTFNDGEHLNVSTSFLNTFFVYLIHQLGLSIPLASHFVSALGISLVAFSSFSIFSKFMNLVYAWLASIIIVFYLSSNSTWGLETHLFAGLLFLFIAIDSNSVKQGYFISSLLFLTRPDGALVIFLEYIKKIILTGWKSVLGKNLVIHGLILLCLLLPWIIFSIINFGQILPDTLSQKMWQARSGFWGSSWNVYLSSLILHLKEFNFLWINKSIGYPLSIIGFSYLLKEKSPLLYLVFFSVIQQIIYILFNVPGYHWYMSFLDLTLIILCILGIYNSIQYLVYFFKIDKFLIKIRINFLNLLLNPIFNIVVFLLLTVLIILLGRSYTLIAEKDLRTEAYKNVAKIVSDNFLTAKSFSSFEVGVYGYYLSKLNAIDLTGLTSERGEFITGTRNDSFFKNPPDLFFAYSPPTHFDDAIMQDFRFLEHYQHSATSKTKGFKDIKIYSWVDEKSGKDFDDVFQKKFVKLDKSECNRTSENKINFTIDTLNGLAPKPIVSVNASRKALNIRGWATTSDSKYPLKEIYLILNNNNTRYRVLLNNEARLDVADAFKENKLINSGFIGYGIYSDLPRGDYHIEICGKLGNEFLLKKSNLIIHLID